MSDRGFTYFLESRGARVRLRERARNGKNVRVLLEEARGLARNLVYHRRARLEAAIGEALDDVGRHVGEPRADRI